MLSTSATLVSALLWGSTTREIDPRVQKVLDILKKVPSFNELLEQPEIKNSNVSIIPLTGQECLDRNVHISALSHEPGDLLWAGQAKILLDISQPFEKQLQGLLVEYCNVVHLKEFAALYGNVKAGRTQKESFAYQMETIEYKAYKKFVEIAQSVQTLFPQYILVTAKNIREAQNFDTYYAKCFNETGHVEKYKRQWDLIRRQNQ